MTSDISNNENNVYEGLLYRIFEKLLQRSNGHIICHNGWNRNNEMPNIAISLLYKLFIDQTKCNKISYPMLWNQRASLENKWYITTLWNKIGQTLSDEVLYNNNYYDSFLGKKCLNVPTTNKPSCEKTAYFFQKIDRLKDNKPFDVKLLNREKWTLEIHKTHSPATFFSSGENKTMSWKNQFFLYFFQVIFPWQGRLIIEDNMLILMFLILIEYLIRQERKLTKKSLIADIVDEFPIFGTFKLLSKDCLLNLWDKIGNLDCNLDSALLLFLFKKYAEYIKKHLCKSDTKQRKKWTVKCSN